MSDPLTIAVFSPEYPPHLCGGLGTHVMNMIPALAKHFRIQLFLPRRGDYLMVPEGVAITEVDIPEGAPGNAELWCSFSLSAADLAERSGTTFGVAVCHDWLTVLAGIALRQRLCTPLVFNVHLPQAEPSYAAMEAAGLRAADVVVVNSGAVAEELSHRGVDRNRSVVIPNGVDLGIYRPAPDWPADDGYILFVGRLVPQKGVVTLLKGFSAVLERCPDARLLVVGDGDLELFLKRIVRYLGIPHRVSFVGWQTGTDLASLYKKARLVVVPSLYEPFGIVAVEAMACGRPVVASRVGGLAEIVRDGIDGLLVSTDDHIQLATALATLMLDAGLRERLGRSARDRAKTYSWTAAADRTADLYRHLAREPVRPEPDPLADMLDHKDPVALVKRLKEVQPKYSG